MIKAKIAQTLEYLNETVGKYWTKDNETIQVKAESLCFKMIIIEIANVKKTIRDITTATAEKLEEAEL